MPTCLRCAFVAADAALLAANLFLLGLHTLKLGLLFCCCSCAQISFHITLSFHAGFRIRINFFYLNIRNFSFTCKLPIEYFSEICLQSLDWGTNTPRSVNRFFCAPNSDKIFSQTSARTQPTPLWHFLHNVWLATAAAVAVAGGVTAVTASCLVYDWFGNVVAGVDVGVDVNAHVVAASCRFRLQPKA